MVSPPSTEKHSKGYANTCEAVLSLRYHSQYIPVLVDENILRVRKLGQVDIAYYHQNLLHLIEAKNSQTGVEHFYRSRQYLRVKKSADFLGFIFDRNTLIKCEALIDNFDF